GVARERAARNGGGIPTRFGAARQAARKGLCLARAALCRNLSGVLGSSALIDTSSHRPRSTPRPTLHRFDPAELARSRAAQAPESAPVAIDHATRADCTTHAAAQSPADGTS